MEGGYDNYDKDEVYSKVVRAGKRTYFFDVKSTRGDDLYLTVTESKKRTYENGDVQYEKHKIFLYKEDFDKFADGLEDALNKISELKASQGRYADEEYTNRHDESSERYHEEG